MGSLDRVDHDGFDRKTFSWSGTFGQLDQHDRYENEEYSYCLNSVDQFA